MGLKQIKVAVKTTNGCCDSLCSECSSVRAVTDKAKTVSNTGILTGSIVPRVSDNAAVWIEGNQCYVNFQYDDVQLSTGVILLPCDLCLVCGCIVEFVENSAGPGGGAQTSITVTDSPSVNLTASGAANHTVRADVLISPNAGNALSQLPNGLHVLGGVGGPGLSDSLVDNVDRTFTHTAANGVQTTFFQGIVTVGSQNNSCLGDVGIGHMVKSMQLIDGDLFIDSAPEHTTIERGGIRQATEGALLPANTFLDPDGNIFQATSIPYAVVNPSPCRPMLFRAFGIISASLILLPGALTSPMAYRLGGQMQINNAAVGSTGFTVKRQIFPGIGIEDSLEVEAYFTVPPASTVTLTLLGNVRRQLGDGNNAANAGFLKVDAGAGIYIATLAGWTV